MDLWTGIFQTMNVLIILVHIFGIYCIKKTTSTNTFGPIQHFYLFQVSLTDIIIPLVHIAETIVRDKYPGAADMFRFVGVLPLYFWYVGVMVLLTLDRFLSIRLNIRYHLFCTLKRTKMMFCVLLLITLSSFALSTTMANEGYSDTYNYLIMSFDLIFLLSAVFIYGYIFMKIRKTRVNQVSSQRLECTNSFETTKSEYIPNGSQAKNINNSSKNNTINNTINNNNNNSNNYNNYNTNNKYNNNNRVLKKAKPTKSGLFTPFLLVASFCLFFIGPNQMFFWGSKFEIADEKFYNFGFLMYQIGLLLDAFIYIFFQREIRKTASTNLNNIFSTCKK